MGVFFVTQVPDDVPAEVLGQLGNRVQHALRAFTPDDAKALKAAASTYPKSDFYDVEELLTSMGIGEAAVTILSTRRRANAGRPHAAARAGLAHRAGRRRGGAAKASPLFAKYGTRVEAESAREKLAGRMEQATAPTSPSRPRTSRGSAAPKKAPLRLAAAWMRSGTSWAPARARRCRAR